jgi:hypothetical protein
MLVRVRSCLSYANVMATVAVFIALGGSSYAALKVTGKQVKDSSLTGADIRNSSLTGSDVKDRSLRAVDFKSGQLPRGPKGDPGPKGDTGTVDTSQFYDKVASDARFLGIGATAHDAQRLAGSLPDSFRARGVHDQPLDPGYSYLMNATLRTVTFNLPAEQKVMFMATAEAWSGPNTACRFGVGLRFDGVDDAVTTRTATAPNVGDTNGFGSTATTGMKTMSAGSHTVTLRGGVEAGCFVKHSSLDALILDG